MLEFDTNIFYFINHTLKNSFFDIIMPIVTNIKYWRIPLILGWLALMIFGGRREREVGILCVFVIILTDAFVAKFIKVYVHRIRPCFDLPDVFELVGTGNYSFPSNHAANNFAVATVIFLYNKKISCIFFALGILIGFSRVYVGVHYPIDVFAGFFVGIYNGIVVYILKELSIKIFTRVANKYFKA